MYCITLIHVCFTRPSTSEWTSSKGSFARNLDFWYRNWCDLPYWQLAHTCLLGSPRVEIPSTLTFPSQSLAYGSSHDPALHATSLQSHSSAPCLHMPIQPTLHFSFVTCSPVGPCFKYRPSRPRYRPISPFLSAADTIWRNCSPYRLQQKTTDIWNIDR